MGILVAVSLSLIIVIYESARPQITILWRIPGPSMYRNMKQESSGTFIQILGLVDGHWWRPKQVEHFS
jgi:sulfate transporter 4